MKSSLHCIGWCSGYMRTLGDGSNSSNFQFSRENLMATRINVNSLIPSDIFGYAFSKILRLETVLLSLSPAG